MVYIAEVVGVALGLEELGNIRVQRVLLVNILQTFLVEDLQGKELTVGAIRCVELSKHREREELGLRWTDSHHSSEAG